MLADLHLQGLNLLVHNGQRLFLGEGDDSGSGRITEMAGQAQVHILFRFNEFLETREIPSIFFLRDGNPNLVESDLGFVDADHRDGLVFSQQFMKGQPF